MGGADAFLPFLLPLTLCRSDDDHHHHGDDDSGWCLGSPSPRRGPDGERSAHGSGLERARMLVPPCERLRMPRLRWAELDAMHGVADGDDDICTGAGLTPATSAPGLGRPTVPIAASATAMGSAYIAELTRAWDSAVGGLLPPKAAAAVAEPEPLPTIDAAAVGGGRPLRPRAAKLAVTKRVSFALDECAL